jgi:hypothetical protein
MATGCCFCDGWQMRFSHAAHLRFNRRLPTRATVGIMAVRRAQATPPSATGGSASVSSWDVVSPGQAPWAVVLPIDEAHPTLRFNPHILHGYRCNLRLWHCARSMLFLHNESCNCLSHLVALVYFSTLAWRFYQAGAYPNLIQVHATPRQPTPRTPPLCSRPITHTHSALAPVFTFMPEP